MQDIRDYRNHMTHGRLSPVIIEGNKIYVPKISKQNDYLDWRIITDSINTSTSKPDFDYLDNVLEDAWETTITSFEKEWVNII